MLAPNQNKSKVATLYRMVTPDHICPFGLKSKALLERKGFDVTDHHLEDRSTTDAFKAKYCVETTPQTFIHGNRVGGYDDLRAFFGKTPAQTNDTTYAPVIAIFAVAALMAAALCYAFSVPLISVRALQIFISTAMCLLGVQKLRDLESFTNQFLGYDLLAQRWVRYAYIYPFAETGAGVLMLGGMLWWVAAPVAIFIGAIGAASVIKAVYVDKRDLKCACVGGNSNVPLGAISLTENVMMVAMGLLMGLVMGLR